MSATALIAAAWSSQASWTVLDTGFADGQAFLALWQDWRTHAKRPAVLHYVAVLSAAEASSLPAATVAALAQPFLELDAGFHRLLLEDGQLCLTLCVGEPLSVLPRQEMQADSVLLTSPEQAWDKWQLKALARCCRRGALLLFNGPLLPSPERLMEAGFAAASATPVAGSTGHEAVTPGGGLQAVYQPHWVLRRPSRGAAPSSRAAASAALPGRCAVIGSGLSGASVAHALAVRGWQVDVYEAQHHSAAGASGLPVGLVVPHHSADDSPRSRLSRAGTRLMLAHAERLLQRGQDWQDGGVLERNVGADVSDEVGDEAGHLTEQDGADRWHPHAAWIKPAQLVQRWLQHPRIHLHTGSAVHTLERVGAAAPWRLRNADGRELGQADQLVFANAYGCADLLARLASALPADFPWLDDVLPKLQALQRLHGTLSLGPMPEGPAVDAFPVSPVNGHGSFVSGVPSEAGPRWYTGATFQSDMDLHADLAREHAANRAKLQTLLPNAAQALSSQFENREVQAWQGSRCITHDRLPLVGPLTAASDTEPTLWLCAGMGSRGLSFSALCAELLAAWMGQEPLPVESTLARSLSTSRVRRRRTQVRV